MKTVVIIDDEPVIRGMLARHFEQLGWRVFESDNGESGVQLVRTHKPFAVLCDLMIPGINGFNVCRTLRTSKAEFGDPVIVVTTGSTFASDRQNALTAGADHYLVKPIRATDVVALLSLKNAAVATLSETNNATAGKSPNARGPVSLRFWGVRGSVPTPGAGTLTYGGNTTCVELRASGEIIILDAGTGIRALGQELIREHGDRPLAVTLLLTHTHWDHIQGFPFFTPAYDARNIINVLGYEGAHSTLLQALSSQMDSAYFPVTLQELTGNIRIRELREMEFTIGRVPVQSIFVNHPGVTLAYRFGTSNGGVVFMPDAEILPSSQADGKTAEFNDYKNQLLAEFAQGAEIFICNAVYTANEYFEHAGTGHSCVDHTVALAILARVKRLILFHHHPEHNDSDIDAMLAHARSIAKAAGSPLVIDAAAESQEIILPPRIAPSATAK